jgi:hypothetical protein
MSSQVTSIEKGQSRTHSITVSSFQDYQVLVLGIFLISLQFLVPYLPSKKTLHTQDIILIKKKTLKSSTGSYRLIMGHNKPTTSEDASQGQDNGCLTPKNIRAGPKSRTRHCSVQGSLELGKQF